MFDVCLPGWIMMYDVAATFYLLMLLPFNVDILYLLLFMMLLQNVCSKLVELP